MNEMRPRVGHIQFLNCLPLDYALMEGGFAAGETYLPEGMAAPGFYQPVQRGLEIRIADKLEELRQRNAQAAVDVTHLPKNETGVK